MRWTFAVLSCGVLFCSAAVAAPPPGLASLKLFKSRAAAKGMWKMELLESSDPKIKEHAQMMNGMAICLDLSGDVSRVDKRLESCKPDIVTNTDSTAELKMTCDDGVPTRVKVVKESDTSFTFAWWRTPKDGPEQAMKIRQTYAGECKPDAGMPLGGAGGPAAPKVVFDKNSEACKMMKAQLGDNPMAQCAALPAAQRGPCEAQMKQVLSMCQ